MNTAELDSYSLDDAVKFNKDLNPRLWHKQRMRPEVREKLLEIAADFKQSLGLSDLEVKDITVSGSNAGFTYTPHSDIDLHLVVDIPQADTSEVYRELFDAKKYQYNAEHNITIGGYDVELYVENANQPPVSQGMYSLVKDDWINIPKRRRSTIDDDAVRSKYADIKHRIQSAIDSQDHEQISAMAAKIKKMRTAGLAQSGEMGPENLAYKMLRAQGYIKKLYDARTAARDLELSLTERKKKKKRVRYGFWSPGFSFGDSEGGDAGGGGESIREVSVTPDGVSPSTKMFLEQDSAKDIDILKSFAQYVSGELGLAKMPRIIIKRKPEWSEQNGSFGQYIPDLNQLTLSLHGRHIIDVLRTLAHELTHAHQQQTTGIPDDGGDTGSDFENEANARAGEFMRHFADAHPEYFDSRTLGESSGYIPTAAEKNDPRFVMALSPDVQPGATGKNANKMSLRTNAQGQPQLAKTNGLVESMMREFANHKSKEEPWDRDGYEPPGPEFPPQMPAGTTKIAVKDLTDWYRLGMDISDMDDAKPEDYNQGPPETVITFASDELEQSYLKQMKRLGLKTQDLDPDVEGGVDTADQHQPTEDLLEVRMSPTNLRKLAADTGAQAGMEFEMIVPNTEVDVEPEYEPDWDQDQRARSFSDVRDFFHDGDYNGRREVDNLIEELAGEYEAWQQEQTDEAWGNDGIDYIRDFVEVNDLFDRDEAIAQARDEVMTANPELPPESEDFQKLLSARLDELQEQFVLEAFEDQGRIYNDAFEAFADEQREEYDERSFLDDKYQTMSDIQSNFDISWPYYYDINDGQDGDMDVDQVADEFSSYMGKPVNASRSYHGGRREAGTYVVEPDGSLEGDNPGDGGLEFVSPPMPIDEMITDLNKVKAWADKTGCYTNDSTGLHINISVPNYSLEKLDYVKLALLMGDEYVLELFGRSGNSYAKSAISKIKGMLQKNPDVAPQVMDKMREHMGDIATKAIHSGTTDKYTSINTKSGYIEFRSPGGDWLDANFSKIENTLLRFTVALSAAIDPKAYRQEYLKKLYKLLEGSQEKGGPDVLQLFANYSAGDLDKAALIRQVRQKQLARNVDKGKVTGKMWWSVGRPGYGASVEVVASSKEEAIEKGKKEYPDWRDAQNITAKPLRPYQEPQANGAAGPTLNGRPSNPDGNYVIVDTANEQTPMYRYMAANSNDALLVLRQWISANPGTQWTFKFDPSRIMGQPAAQQQSAQQGNWGIWIVPSDRFARQPNTIVADNVLRRFPSQAAAMAFLERTREENPRMRTDIEIREIPADYELPSTPIGTPVNRNTLAPTGPGPWEVFRISDGSSVAELGQTNRMSAEVEARGVIDQRREAPELYGVRTRASTDAAQGGTVDVATDRAAPQTLTRPGQGQQTFTGTWLVLDPQDREIYRFSGVGNSQSDANRVAMNWMRQHPGAMQAGVTVVPEMG